MRVSVAIEKAANQEVLLAAIRTKIQMQVE